MKTKTTAAFAALAIFISPSLPAAEKGHEGHDHGSHDESTHEHVAKIAGPNGGRIVTTTEPHFEFFVTEKRMIRITFVDDDNKVLDPDGKTVSAVGGDRSAPTRMTFSKDGDSLVSDKPLPEGNKVPIILQVKTAPDGDNVTERFNVDLSDCTSCKHKEYACTCDH